MSHGTACLLGGLSLAAHPDLYWGQLSVFHYIDYDIAYNIHTAPHGPVHGTEREFLKPRGVLLGECGH